MPNLEATISLCDPMNPGCGYQIHLTRSAPPGTPVDVLFTSRDPATGKDLLTYEQCLDVLAMYRNAPRMDASREHAHGDNGDIAAPRRNVFIFTRTRKPRAGMPTAARQWCINLHGGTDRPLFTQADAAGFKDPRIAVTTFTVEAVG